MVDVADVADREPPVLVVVTRDGFVESRHRGSLVMLDERGHVEVDVGATTPAVYPRSTLKPLQAAAMVDAGFPGRGPSLALAAASHDGEQQHLDGVRATLSAAGTDESALRCPASLPAGPAAVLAWVRAGGSAAPVCHNCSGKHAAMIATCVAAGWPVASYLEPEHPLQIAIRNRIERSAGEPAARSAVDGCGAPAFAVSLTGLARAFAALAGAPSGAEREVAAAMRAHPELVSGSGRVGPDLMREVPGLVGKDGAEGVWAAALPDGRAFAVKFEDGAGRGCPPLAAAVLRRWGFDGPAVRRWAAVPTLGGGRPVGSVTWSPQLRDLLGL
jgi:L-asparaginase II